VESVCWSSWVRLLSPQYNSLPPSRAWSIWSLLVHPISSFSVNLAEPCDANVDFYGCFALVALCCCSASFCGAGYGAEDFRVAHFEIAGAVGGGLGGDLCVQAP
jgi:hypothetical protein